MKNIAKGVFAILVLAMIILELPSFAPIGLVQAEQGYSFDAKCVSTECVKLKVRLMCDNENELIRSYLDCRTILSCIDLEEQIKMYCAGGYSLTIVKA